MNDTVVLTLSAIGLGVSSFMAGFSFAMWKITGKEKIPPDKMPEQLRMPPPKGQRLLDEISPFAPKPKAPVQPVVRTPLRPHPKPPAPKETTWKPEPKPDPKWSEIKDAANGKLPDVEWGKKNGH